MSPNCVEKRLWLKFVLYDKNKLNSQFFKHELLFHNKHAIDKMLRKRNTSVAIRYHKSMGTLVKIHLKSYYKRLK